MTGVWGLYSVTGSWERGGERRSQLVNRARWTSPGNAPSGFGVTTGWLGDGHGVASNAIPEDDSAGVSPG